MLLSKKNPLALLALTLLLAALLLGGCRAPVDAWQSASPQPAPTATAATSADQRSNVALTLALDREAGTLSGGQTLDYYNATGQTLDCVYFHLYPNAFAREEQPPLGSSSMEEMYPEGFDAGGIAVSGATVNGAQATYALEGGDQVLKVTLSQPLAAGERASIALEFSVDVPVCQGRFGRTAGGSMFRLAYAVPQVCAYDATGWHTEGYTAVGDPIYSEAADYAVTLTCPAGMVAATSGDTQTLVEGEETWTYTIRGQAAREFAAVVGSGLQVLTAQAGEVEVLSYYYGEQKEAAQRALEVAVEAVKVYSEAYCPYPAPRLSVVECGLGNGGMEFPNLVMIDEPAYAEDAQSFQEVVVAHEVAHQWFYSLVGDDQVNAPFLDEAFAEFSTAYYYEATQGKQAYQAQLAAMRQELEESETENPQLRAIPLTAGVADFESASDYGNVIYTRGALLLASTRERLGDELFFQAMQRLTRQYAHGILTFDGLTKLLDELQAGTGDWFASQLAASASATPSSASPAAAPAAATPAATLFGVAA